MTVNNFYNLLVKVIPATLVFVNFLFGLILFVAGAYTDFYDGLLDTTIKIVVSLFVYIMLLLFVSVIV